MGDIDGGQAQPLLDLADLFADMAAQFRIEVRERLIEKQHLGFQDDGAGDGDALLLAAGKFGGQARAKALEAHGFQPGFGAVADFGAGQALDRQAVAHVFQHGHMGKERVGLEHHRHASIGGGQVGDILAPDQDAPGAGAFQPGDQAQGGGLAAARGAQQGDQRAGGDVEREWLERHDIAEGLCHILEPDGAFHGGLFHWVSIRSARRRRRRPMISCRARMAVSMVKISTVA